MAKGKSKKGKGKKDPSKGKANGKTEAKAEESKPEDAAAASKDQADEFEAAASKNEPDEPKAEPKAAASKKDGGDDEKRPPDPDLIVMLRKADDAIGLFEHTLLVLFLGTLIFVGTYHSFASQVLNKNAAWPYEMIRFSVFFIAMTGAALAAQRHRMISMDIVTRMLGPRRKAIARIVVGLFVIFMCALLIRGGWAVRESVLDETNYEIIRPATGLLALPIGAAFIGFHYFIHTLIDVIYLMNGIEPPEPEAQVH